MLVRSAHLEVRLSLGQLHALDQVGHLAHVLEVNPEVRPAGLRGCSGQGTDEGMAWMRVRQHGRGARHGREAKTRMTQGRKDKHEGEATCKREKSGILRNFTIREKVHAFLCHDS